MASSASLARLTCLSLTLSSATPLGAQDAHYWTVQYGPRASLLGGAVIGAVSDVSAAFYNPGGLALADSLGFAFSISVLEHRRTTADGGVVGSEDVSSDRTGMAPSMLGGAIQGPSLGKHRLAYSLITRQRSRVSASELVINSTPTFETLASHLSVEQSATERWGGVSWAYALRSSVGVGATAFVSSRSDVRSLRVSVVGSESGEGLVSTRVRDFGYEQYSLIGKLASLRT